MVFIKKISTRNPFQILSLPFLARLYRFASQRKPSRLYSFLVNLPVEYFFRFVFTTLKMKGTGAFVFDVRGEKKVLRFNARNTQYHALYFPRFKHGYESPTTALLDTIVEKNGNFFDIGSNWGYFSLFVASRKDFTGEIFSFEPMPATFEDLREMTRTSGLQNIKCHQVALGDIDGNGYMTLPDNVESGLAKICSDNSGVQVPIRTLDSLKLPSPTVLKIDVEGHEGKVFRGAIKTLKSKKPMLIFESTINDIERETAIEPFTLLDSIGYKFFYPAFFVNDEINCWRMTLDNATHSAKSLSLALIPFAIEQRFLLGEQINCFACHVKKLDKLARLFENY